MHPTSRWVGTTLTRAAIAFGGLSTAASATPAGATSAVPAATSAAATSAPTTTPAPASAVTTTAGIASAATSPAPATSGVGSEPGSTASAVVHAAPGSTASAVVHPGDSAAAAPEPETTGSLNVVVLGDSYAAGSGSADSDRSACDRSASSWGVRYANHLRARALDVHLRNAACAGARVGDLEGQLAAVTAETDLVVLTIGGNDIGFTDIVSACFVPFAAEPDRCRKAIANGRAIAAEGQRPVAERLRAIADRMRPGGRIALLSYPYLAADSPYRLGWLWYRYDAGVPARSLGDLVDQTQRAAVDAVNASLDAPVAEFVPTKDLFAGHEPDENPFADNPDGWIWEFSGLQALGSVYHLRPEGNAAMASALARAGGPSGDFGARRR